MESKWGVFTLLHSAVSHVAPCDERGKVLKPHTLRADCPCCPRLEMPQESGDHDAIVIHNELTIH